MIEKTDVVIIGAGPVGLFAIFELGLLNISCHVIDNLDKPGGQCAELYPEKPIYDIPSRVSISGQELTDDLLAQAKPFKPVYHLSQQVEKIEKLESNEWLIVTSVNKSIQAKCIVIAAGAGSFVPRKLPIKDIEHLEEKNILYAVRNKSILEGKKLLIVGGGDSALDWTNELSKASKVTLMHRRKEFKASPDSVSKMLELEKNKKVNFLLGQIQNIVSRNVPPLETCVISVTQIHAGAAYNVVPETAYLAGTIRYFSDAVYEMVETRMKDLCEGFGKAYGVSVSIDLRNIFDVLTNDDDLSDEYMKAAADIVGVENIDDKAEPATGSEDFADMLKVVPGAYCRVGHGGTVPLHNPSFVLDQEVLPVGASIMARIIERRIPMND